MTQIAAQTPNPIVGPTSPDQDSIVGQAANLPFQYEVLTGTTDVITGGGVAVFPADTVYGLACNPLDSGAVERLYALKGRPPGKAAALMFFDLEAASAALPELGERTRAALRRPRRASRSTRCPRCGRASPPAARAAARASRPSGARARPWPAPRVF